MNRPVKQPIRIFSSETIAASGTATSTEITINSTDGFFSVYFELTGSGSMDLVPEVSYDGTTFLTPLDTDGVRLSNVVSGFTSASGPGSDGKEYAGVSIPVAPKIRFKATEAGGANSVTVDAWLIFQ